MQVVQILSRRIGNLWPTSASAKETSTWHTTGAGLISANDPGAPSSNRALAKLKFKIMDTLQDCDPSGRSKAVLRIHHAQAAYDLWLLRIDVYHCIARTHGQREARKRINNLLDDFDGWLPRRHLHAIA